jgi:hypothetical protein
MGLEMLLLDQFHRNNLTQHTLQASWATVLNLKIVLCRQKSVTTEKQGIFNPNLRVARERWWQDYRKT